MDRQEARRREATLNQNFQQLNRQSQQLESQIERKKLGLKKIQTAEEIFTDLQIKKQHRLETLSQNLKGGQADSFLSEALINHQNFHRYQARQIQETKRSLNQEMRGLYEKQEELTRAKRLLNQGGR